MKRKSMKERAAGLLMTLVMIMSLAMTAFAETPAATAQIGKLTIKGTTEGKEYDLYRIFDLTQDGENYSYSVNENFTDYFTGDKEDAVNYVMSLDTAEKTAAFAKDILTWAVEKGVTPAQTVTGATGATETVVEPLEYGYYLMNPLGAGVPNGEGASVFALGTLSGNNGDMEIVVKTTYPELDKKVDEDLEKNEASIGDTVTFKLTTKVPDMTGYNKYFMVVSDTMSKGLAFTADSVEITIGGEALAKDQFTVYTNGSDADGTELQIVFKDAIKHAADAGKDVVITYTATLTEHVEVGTANENSAKLIYSNDPKANAEGGGQPINPDENPDPDPDLPGTDDPTGETVESKTETYTTDITISKVDGEGNALTGAEFTLTGDGVNVAVVTKSNFVVASDGTYYLLADGTYTETAQDGYVGDMYKKEITTEVITKDEEAVNVKAEVGTDGKLTFKGLGAGTYTITESKVPNGYNPIDPITFTVGFTAEDGFTVTDANGVTVEDNRLAITITNLSGSVLPETGGMGTTIFTAAGIILMIGAVVVLIVRRRMSSRDL